MGICEERTGRMSVSLLRRFPPCEMADYANAHPHYGLSSCPAVLDAYPGFVIDCRAFFPREFSMKKIIVIALATVALSISPALAKKKMAKPKAPPAAAATAPAPGPMMAPGSAKDREMYMKNKRDSGMK